MLPPPLPPTLLVADIGGTNLNLALAEPQGDGVRLLRRVRYATQAEPALLPAVLRFLSEVPELRPQRACFAGAGPVTAGRIVLTNAPWDIDGPALEAALGIPVAVINDFSATCQGVLLLDPSEERQVGPLLHPDGRHPAPDPQGTILVVGAGTGLGVGFITRDASGARVHPSEGGHIGLPLEEEAHLALWQHLRPGFPAGPGAEAAVSGPGLANLLAFLLATQRAPGSPATVALQALPPEAQPPAIAEAADSDAACGQAMDLFVDLYARVCAQLCAAFLPTGGLFLAGGIAAKNERRLRDDHRFMRSFERNYRDHLDTLTRATPVFIVRDYGLSLLGAARAALS